MNKKINAQILPMPPFLAFEFGDFNFKLQPKQTLDNSNFKQTLQDKFLPNTIVVYNGKIIFNGLSSGVVASCNLNEDTVQAYKKSNSTNLLQQINKQNLSSALNLTFFKNASETIQVVIASDHDIAHFSNYNLSQNANIVVNEEFMLFKNSKINYQLTASVLNNSYLKMVQLQNANANASCFAHSIKVNKNATANLVYLNLNGKHTVNNSYLQLCGEYASGQINTLSLANKSSKHANLVNITHTSPFTKSNITNVAVVNNTAQVNIDGVNKIEKGNYKSEANQETRIINLINTCKSVANPQLIINEYDVKAGHAAAVGQPDEEQIYYLMSRGLTKQQAMQLLIMSYVTPVLQHVENKKMIQILKNKIKSKIK